ncbi:hypothetical protein QBC46DRAFT_386610 [Diplogelasinospora grovesii]|uniref:CCHC-type domain-containing protein n=1 Tax=Diplogelasinospora grovesii TaxID=303347 RepID=A0AAN6S481_9PEZI|nr:hypothetical protein QBC46DRAFT_386610 [Diplogelasinospora grovesii]
MARSPAAGGASGLQAMSKQSTPKTMSSRLMTMKFMQRGAAASTPDAESPTTPKIEDEGSAKRRKVSHTPATSKPSTPIYDQKAVKAALEEEEKKRQAAVAKRAAELGDSHWVLDATFPTPASGSRAPLSVVQVGFAQIDSPGLSHEREEDSFENVQITARGSFLQFNMKRSKKSTDIKKEKDEEEEGELGSDDDSDDDSSSDSSDDGSQDQSSSQSRDEDESDRGRRNSPTNDAARKRARSSVSSKRSEERRKSQQLAAKRRKKEIKLNTPTSISGAGGLSGDRPSFPLTCHACGKLGHKIADCPNKRR